MHYWGDEDFSNEMFHMVGDAADEIGAFCRRWGRIQVTQTKEKYGTARVYCHFGAPEALFWLWKPGYVYYRWPKWLYTFDRKVFGTFFKLFNTPVCKWQMFIYRLAYKRAIAKYPLIKAEIINGADQYELLKDLDDSPN